MKKQILSMLLAIVMVVGLLPGASLSAFAEDPITYTAVGAIAPAHDVEKDGSTVIIAFDGEKALAEVIPPDTTDGEEPNPGTGSGEDYDLSVFHGTRTDFRDESVYTLLISRFYDGDSGNNVHCWDDGRQVTPIPTPHGAAISRG